MRAAGAQPAGTQPTPGRAPRTAGALVFDGDTRAALAVVRSLARRGIQVTVAAPSLNSLAGASRHAHRRLVLPDPMTHPRRLAEELVALAVREPGMVWIPVADPSLVVVDEIRAQLPGVHIPIPPSGALARAWDKSHLPEVAKTAGFLVPRTWLPSNAAGVRALAAELPYPVVLKPRQSRWRGPYGFVAGTVDYVRARDDLLPAWEAMHASIPAPLIQERVTGTGMGLFLLADHGRVLARFAHRRLREKPPSGGVSVLCESIPVPADLAVRADRLMKALDWHGVCMIEFKIDARDGRPWLIEINPRFWGSLELAVAAGVDFPWLLFQLALGHPAQGPSSYRVGVRSRWELGDLDHLLIQLRKRHSSDRATSDQSRLANILAFLDPFAGRPEVFRWHDPGPGWHELRTYLRALRGRAGAGAPRNGGDKS